MSKIITEPAKQIDVIHETDVLVVGSGPGGLAAALAATALAVKTRCDLADVDMTAVQGALAKQGVRYH